MPNDAIENEEKYFVRVKGRVVGPFTVKQLNTLRVRGQFSQSNEVSADGQNWESAATLESVFGTTKKTKREIDTDTRESIAPSPDSDQWHYSIDGEQHAATTSAKIHQMLETGDLNLRDLVWKEGMEDWAPLAEIPEFNRAPADSGSKKSTGKRQAREDVSEVDSEYRHFFDILLHSIRSQFDQNSVGRFSKASIEYARYASYVCILCQALFCLTLAIKSKSLDVGLLAAIVVFVGLGLQYGAIKICYVIRNLLLAMKHPMSSRSFFDVVSVTFATAGVVQFIFLSVQAIRTNTFEPLLIGVAGLLICVRVAIDALFPEAMGYYFKKDIRIGEEGLSIFAYFLILPVRIVAELFSAGSTISTIGVLAAFVLMFSNSDKTGSIESAFAALSWSGSLLIANVSMAAPFFGYIIFAIAFVIVDVLRSILDLPPKLDQINLTLVKEPQPNEAAKDASS